MDSNALGRHRMSPHQNQLCCIRFVVGFRTRLGGNSLASRVLGVVRWNEKSRRWRGLWKTRYYESSSDRPVPSYMKKHDCQNTIRPPLRIAIQSAPAMGSSTGKAASDEPRFQSLSATRKARGPIDQWELSLIWNRLRLAGQTEPTIGYSSATAKPSFSRF